MKNVTKTRTVEIHGRKFDVQDGGRCWMCKCLNGRGYNIRRRELRFISSRCGHLRSNVRIDGEYKTIYAHELVALAFIGRRDDGYHIHHVNGDKHDNRAKNLEYISAGNHTRHHNYERPENQKSRFRGVGWNSAMGKYRARGTDSGGVNRHIGLFTFEVDAARAFNEFAKLNGYDDKYLNALDS